MLLNKKILHTTESYIKKLSKVWIKTVYDFINHYPKTYENKSNILEYFSYINLKEKNTIKATIESINQERTKNNKILIKAILKDKWWLLCESVWFNRKYLLMQFKSQDEVIIFWKPNYSYWKLSFISPDIELASNETKTIQPVYPDLNYIPWSWFESKIKLLQPYFNNIENIIPESIKIKKWFCNKKDNLFKIHFPSSEADFKSARNELAYEELFILQYNWILRKRELEKFSKDKSFKIKLNPDLIKEIISYIPYALTNSQKISIFQILKDMEKNYAMNRLLEWDVWTGKTIVALITAIHAIIEWKIQVAFMAPTEILARQHFISIQNLLQKYNIKSDLLVWSLKNKEKDEIKNQLNLWIINFIVWTHALIQKWVNFKNLWYVIIDEQHRFGVEQRKILESGLNFNPHNLYMTATPIPRTLALTIYWDQDISILNEYPIWRKLIHTKVIKEFERDKVYYFIDEEIRSWKQIYWISPLVEESETLDIANATEMQQNLQIIFPKYTIWLIHWKLKPKEKENIMTDFMTNKIQILSSTSVVEVWVDNQNATVICIEAAERFWLSQLHQFRWRVWRWKNQSYCYLFTTKNYVWERLRALEQTNNWFELSEIDLKLRGPWEVYWVRQSWVPDFKIADLKDFELISEIREDIIEEMLKK